MSESKPLPTRLPRKLHAIDFQGKPAWLRVPTAEEAILAELQGARWVSDQTGKDDPVDPDIWTVSAATGFVLAKALVDSDGCEQWTGKLMLEHHTQDELCELLDKLNAVRLAESKNPPRVDDAEVDRLTLTLSGCSEQDAYDVFVGVDHEHMARIALGLARRLKNTEAARVAPLDDIATT